MKPSRWDKQLGLASPLKCAAIQSGQTNNPSRNETGLDASHHTHVSPEGRGKYFFLDILFNRMSDIAMLQSGRSSTVYVLKRSRSSKAYWSADVSLAPADRLPYAAYIRAGRHRPHPRHWLVLAKLVGVSEGG
jgi:hypothetical protein